MLIPNKHSGFSFDGSRRCFLDSGGGGGGQGELPEKTVTNIVELPEWARGYAKDLLAKGAALTDINQNPYQTYSGPRTAGFSDLQKQTFAQAGPQGYQKTVGQYMSPYINDVLNQQVAASNRGYDITAAQEQAKATQAGAFGGGRQAVMAAENERARNSANQAIVAKGLQDAFQGATSQYNTGLQQLSTLGGQQQAQQQKEYDVGYQEYLNRQNQPYRQLSYMADLVRGTPVGQASSQQIYQAAPSTASQVAGLGLAAAGAYGAVNGKAKGGKIKAKKPKNDAPAGLAELALSKMG